MSRYALITGASSGIGEELARVFAREGWNLIIVARRIDRLNDLANELTAKFNIEAIPLQSDLSDSNHVNELYQTIIQKDIKIEVLVNNAGFGANGAFREIDMQKQENMINLNILALTKLTHLLLPGMVSRGKGAVLNIASTAAFQPGPFMAVYYASKAYVLSFSEAINNELKGTGVSCTALCPGPTQSEFQEKADVGDKPLFKMKTLATSKEVAEYAYKAMINKKSVAIYGLLNKIGVQLLRFTPRNIVVNIVRKLQEPK